jgi:hypothetical protein
MAHSLNESNKLKRKSGVSMKEEERKKDVHIPLLDGLIPMAPYIPLAISDVVKIRDTPESKTAMGDEKPVTDVSN